MVQGLSMDGTAKQVKTVSRDNRFARIRALDCYQEVYDRILAGWAMSEVAKYIQDECGEYADVTRGSLISMLNEFRGSIPRAELVAKRMPQVFHKAAEEVEKGLDELHELELLYRIQMERVGVDFTTEKKISKLMPTMTQEIKEARQILETYSQLKMDLGIAKRHIGQVDVDAHLIADVAGKYGKQSVVRVLSDPESRRKVLGVVERVAAALPGARHASDDDEIIDAELDLDGGEPEVTADEELVDDDDR